MKHLLMTGIIGAILLAPAAFGSDVTGKWTAEFETPRGVSELEFHFKVEGDQVTGTVATARGESDIQDGKITGDEISFKQVMNFGREITILYTGKISGDEIEFERTFQRPAGRGGPGGRRRGGLGAGGPGPGPDRESQAEADRPPPDGGPRAEGGEGRRGRRPGGRGRRGTVKFPAKRVSK